MSTLHYKITQSPGDKLHVMAGLRSSEELHRLIDQLTPDQLRELHAYAQGLAASGGRRTFVPWHELRDSASRLPPMDYTSFRADLDTAVDQDDLLGDC